MCVCVCVCVCVLGGGLNDLTEWSGWNFWGCWVVGMVLLLSTWIYGYGCKGVDVYIYIYML